MNEIIERVAKAIEKASQPPGQKDYKILMENAARAAIEAMRKPTDAMKRSGALCMPDYDPSVDDAQICWEAMIDAALLPS